MNIIEIGKRIKKARHIRNVTLDEIASKVGVTKSTIQRYETGQIQNPKIPVLHSIANALNVNPAWIVGKVNDMEPLQEEQPRILKYYNALNSIGKQEAEKRVEELTYITKYTEKSSSVVKMPEPEYNTLNAAHADDYDSAPESMKQLEEDIMDDENF